VTSIVDQAKKSKAGLPMQININPAATPAAAPTEKTVRRTIKAGILHNIQVCRAQLQAVEGCQYRHPTCLDWR